MTTDDILGKTWYKIEKKNEAKALYQYFVF